MLGYPPWLWLPPSSHGFIVLWLVFSDHLSRAPGTDREEEEKLKLGLHSACLICCFSAPGHCWQGRGEVILYFQHMDVCGEFGTNGVRKKCCRGTHFCAPMQWVVMVSKAFLLQSWWLLRHLPSSHPARRWLRFPENWGAAVEEGQDSWL